MGQQRLPPWFFLLPSYWRTRAAGATDEKLLARLLSTSVSGGSPCGNGSSGSGGGGNDKGIAVAISDLRKSYAAADGTTKQVRMRVRAASQM